MSKKKKKKKKSKQINKQKTKLKVYFLKNFVSVAIKVLKFLRIDVPIFHFFNFPSPNNFEKRIIKSLLFKTDVEGGNTLTSVLYFRKN